MPTVLVTDAGRGSALAVIRSLARDGWRVVAADTQRNSIGFHSRYADNRYVYPSPEESAKAFVASIREAVFHYGIDLVIPVTDDTLLPLAEARDSFADVCQLAIAGDRSLEWVTDKCATTRLAQRVGVPAPATYVAHSTEEARDVAHLLPWPVVLKAQRSRQLQPGKGVKATGGTRYADNVEDLVSEMQRFNSSCPVLLQPYCGGVGHGVEMLAYRGRPLAVFQHRRLAEVPVTGGASAMRESVALDPELYEYSRRLVRALQWTGLVMIEFKVDDERATLIEINGRIWGSLPLAVHSGMDFPARLAHLYLDGPPTDEEPVASDYRIGLRVCNLDLMAVWLGQVLAGQRRYSFLSQPPRREALKEMVGLLDPRLRYDVQTLKDPVPGIMEFFQVVNKLSRKVSDMTS